ncbi:hypothetical protein BH11CYA1_BH11CYA1_25780 [soil metagenome]
MQSRCKNEVIALVFAAAFCLQLNYSCLAAPSSAVSANSANKSSAKLPSRKGGSLKRKISAEQAVALVKKRADVKRFLALFPNGKSQATQGYPVVEAEALDCNWNVHVYEQTPEHTATMNWFEVNSQTGSIKPMTD